MNNNPHTHPNKNDSNTDSLVIINGIEYDLKDNKVKAQIIANWGECLQLYESIVANSFNYTYGHTNKVIPFEILGAFLKEESLHLYNTLKDFMKTWEDFQALGDDVVNWPYQSYRDLVTSLTEFKQWGLENKLLEENE